jgi:hypothetical protein
VSKDAENQLNSKYNEYKKSAKIKLRLGIRKLGSFIDHILVLFALIQKLRA